MKSIVWKALASALVTALVCGNAYAQASAAAAGTAAPAAGKSTQKAAAKAARKSNRQLGYAVRKAITKAGGVDVSNLVVRAKGGAISLQGTVPDQSQIDKAGEAAQGVTGVTSVDNQLTIQQQ